MRIKNTIEERLSRKEVHQLLSLCKKYFPIPLSMLQSHEEFLKEHKKNSLGKNFYKKLLDTRKVHDLFKKAEIQEADYLPYWGILREFHRHEAEDYRKQSKPERKDNKTYLNRGNGCSNANKVRYPKKARKTAWKRFYRLFPSLDPERNKKLNEELTTL